MMKHLKEGKYSFDEKDILGSGSFARVYKGHDVALKQIQLKKLQRYGEDFKQIICSEINVMRKFTKRLIEIPCPFLVQSQDCFRTDSYIYIVMQFCDGGTLLDYLYGNKLQMHECIQIIYQIANAIKYLSEIGIVHRDLKPQNIFLKKYLVNGVQKLYFKVGDFGFAAQKECFTTTLGTFPYMAPQIYKKEGYGIKADIWSLGIISFQIIFGELYFTGKDKWEIAKNIKDKPFKLTPDQKQKVSEQLEDFMTKCLEKDQQLRIGPKQLLDHPLFNTITAKHQHHQTITILHRIYHLEHQCLLYQTLAENIASFAHQQHRKTQFIEIYLLKQAYARMNRIAYSVIHKQNHLGLDPSEFEKLFTQQHQKQYNKLKAKLQSQCSHITLMFQEKYKQFKKYITKFTAEDQQRILQLVNQQPYATINPTLIKQETTKWIPIVKDKKQYKEIYKGFQSIMQH